MSRLQPDSTRLEAVRHTIAGASGRRRLYAGYLIQAIREVLAKPELHLPKWFKAPGRAEPSPEEPPEPGS